MRRARIVAVALGLTFASWAEAFEATPQLLQAVERLRAAAAANDRQLFGLILKQSLSPQLERLDRGLGVRSKLQADQVQLQHVLGGLLAGWTLLALDAALAGDDAAWRDVRLLGGQMRPWLQDHDATLALAWSRALSAAQASADPDERRDLFVDVRAALLKIVVAAFDPAAAIAHDRERDAAVQPTRPTAPASP